MWRPSDAEVAATGSMAPPCNDSQALQDLAHRRSRVFIENPIETATTFITAKVVIMTLTLTKCIVVSEKGKKLRLLINCDRKEL